MFRYLKQKSQAIPDYVANMFRKFRKFGVYRDYADYFGGEVFVLEGYKSMLKTNPCVQGCQCLVPICHLTKYVSFRSFLTDTTKGFNEFRNVSDKNIMVLHNDFPLSVEPGESVTVTLIMYI